MRRSPVRPLAIVAVLGLLLTTLASNPAPEEIARIDDARDGQTVTIACEMLQVHQSPKGWTLTFEDTSLRRFDGFLPRAGACRPPSEGPVRLVGRWSEEGTILLTSCRPIG